MAGVYNQDGGGGAVIPSSGDAGERGASGERGGYGGDGSENREAIAVKENIQGQKPEETKVPRVTNLKPTDAPDVILGHNKEQTEVEQATNLIKEAATLVKETTNLVTNLVKEATNLVKEATNLVKQATNPKLTEAPDLVQSKEEAELKQATNPIQPEALNLIKGQNKKEAAVPRVAPGVVQPRLTVEETLITQSYMSCANQFYTQPEMIKFMTANHGVTKQSVKRVFAELMKGRNAAAYRTASEQRSLERKRIEDERLEAETRLQRITSGSFAGTSGQGGGASSSSSSRRNRRRGK